MDSLAFFCATCGAANPAAQGVCFACGQNLEATAAPLVADTHSHTGSLFPGVLLNARYQIMAQVGTGGFGAVYKARDTNVQNRLVAIKEINLRGLTPTEVIEATDTFNREITTLSGLNHKSLPQLYDHFTDAEHWYLVMEFIEGETLEEYLQKTPHGTLPLEDVLDIGIQLCVALEYLHLRHPPIIFRDVKPANIMRTPTGHLYLIDFGIARYLKPGQARDTIALGSPGFAAPEQYGKAQTTQQSDIYSLGVTLHTLLTGNDPSENPFRLPALSTYALALPTALETLLEQMLALPIDKRPASVAVVQETLRRIAMRQFSTLYPPVPAVSKQMATSTPASKPSRRVPATVQRTAVNIVVTGVVALLLFGSCVVGNAVLSFHPYFYGKRSEPGMPSKAAFQQLRIPVISQTGFATLDPALAVDSQSTNAVSMLFSGLVSLNASLNVQPQLASSWDMSPDALTWTFHLRPNLRFSDGTPLTSADVVYSFDRALQPKTESPTALSYLGIIRDAVRLHSRQISTLIDDSLLTPDAETVVIKLSKPAVYFANALAYPSAFIVEKSLIQKYGNKTFSSHLLEGGSTGPFKMDRYSAGYEVDFVTNPNYSGPLPQLTEITFTYYKSAEDAYRAYQDGQVDIVNISSSLFNSPSVQYTSYRLLLQPTTYYYTMNYLEKPFDNIHIRQAFALAINRDTLNQFNRDAHLLPVFPTDHIVPSGTPAYNSSLVGPDNSNAFGDRGKALSLLQQGLREEGWSNISQLPPITFTYARGSLQVNNEAQIVCEMWRDTLGVQVRPNPVSATMLRQEIAATASNPHGLQLWASSWSATYTDPEDFTTLQFAQGSPLNTMNYGQNNSFNAAQQQATQLELEHADSLGDLALRVQQYHDAEQQLVNDVAWIPLYQTEMAVLVKNYVNGLYMQNGILAPPTDWPSVYIYYH